MSLVCCLAAIAWTMPGYGNPLTYDGDFNAQKLGDQVGAPWSCTRFTVVASAQSPFDNIYARNGKGVKVAAGGGGGISAYFSRGIYYGATGQIYFNLDFRNTSNAPCERVCRTVVVTNGFDQNVRALALYIGNDGVYAESSTNGRADKPIAGESILTPELNKWYNVQLTLDLETKTYSGVITKEDGAQALISKRNFYNSAGISCIYMENGLPATGPFRAAKGETVPAHDFDNFALSDSPIPAPVITTSGNHPRVPFTVNLVKDEETSDARRWVATNFQGGSDVKTGTSFFSFNYDGTSSEQWIGSWGCARESRPLDEKRTEHTITYSDPKTGLVVRCVGIEYRDFPAVEWVLYFQNTGDKDTPILKDIQALDTRFARAAAGDFLVHHIRGSDASPGDYAPISDTVTAKADLILQSHGWPTSFGSAPSGSPSVEAVPMFNAEWGSQGVIAALGWTGPWIAAFHREGEGALRIQARMDGVNLLLHPGEQIRSQQVLLLFWRGERNHAHNVWRRLLLAHYSPQPGGKPFTGLLCDLSWGKWMNGNLTIEEIRWWGDHDLPMECLWMDAGWTDMTKGWEAHQSQHTPRKDLFPQGLRPVSDAARARDMKFLLWMVPGSVHPEVGIGKEHPEWLGKPFSIPEYGKMIFHGLDHGDPKVNAFMIDYYSKVIADHGVDVLRHDGLHLWPADTAPDRLGISQIRYVEGFYAFWDGLLKNAPNLLIDNCGCGGRKLDLEMIRRSVVFWRSDCQARTTSDPDINLLFNQGLSPWIPLFGGVVHMDKPSAYSFRSAYCPVMSLAWPEISIDNLKRRWMHMDIDLLRRLLREYLSVRPYLFGDYYPLLPYTAAADSWAAWQWDRPDLGEGMVQAFRRAKSPTESMTFKLQGLVPDAVYTLANLDDNRVQEMSGKKLMQDGFAITLKGQPGSSVITYRRK